MEEQMDKKMENEMETLGPITTASSGFLGATELYRVFFRHYIRGQIREWK